MKKFFQKLETLRHRNSSEVEVVDDCHHVPVDSYDGGYKGHAPLRQTQSSVNGNVVYRSDEAMMNDHHISRHHHHPGIRVNNGYASEVGRSSAANNKHNTLDSENNNGKPVFVGNNIASWPDDEFNEGYADPNETNNCGDEYDSPDEPDNDVEPTSLPNIGQTGFFGDGTNEAPPVPPPANCGHHYQSNHGKLQQQTQMKADCGVGSGHSNNNNTKQAFHCAPTSSVVSSTPPSSKRQSRGVLSSAGPSSSSNGVTRNDSINRRLFAGLSSSCSPSDNATPFTSLTTTITTTAATHDQQQQHQAPQLPQRPHPKVLGSRISEGLDTNKVVTGLQNMVKMNQPGTKMVPPTPPKPNFPMNDRFIHPPQTVTPPDSDPELPSRMKSIIIDGNTALSSSPSPSSETVSSGTTAVAPAKKRQAPAPPMIRANNLAKTTPHPPPPPPLVTNSGALPPPVTEFIINNSNNQTPSVTSSSEGGDDLSPMPPPLPKESLVKTKALVHQSSTSPNAVNGISSTSFTQRQSSNKLPSVISQSQSLVAANKVVISNKFVPRGTPSAAKSNAAAVATTSFTSSRSSTQVPDGSSSVQVTVLSTGATNVSTASTSSYEPSGSSMGTAQYASDDDIYTGAESLQYNLFTFDWYHGKMSREDSERKLREVGKEGGFLVRDCNNTSSQPNALFTLCLFAKKSCHYIQVCRRPEANDRLAVGSQKESEKTFSTLQELIKFHMSEAPLVVQPRSSMSGNSQQFLCSLQHPIARIDR